MLNMVRKTETDDIEQLFKEEIPGHVDEVEYNQNENCVDVIVNSDPDELLSECSHLSEVGYSIRAEEDRLKIY